MEEQLKKLKTQIDELEKRIAALENPEPIECEISEDLGLSKFSIKIVKYQHKRDINIDDVEITAYQFDNEPHYWEFQLNQTNEVFRVIKDLSLPPQKGNGIYQKIRKEPF